MKHLTALSLATLAAALLAATAAASTGALPSIYGTTVGQLTLPDGSTHVEAGEGWVQRHPRIRLVFWGSSWLHDTTGIVPAETALFRELPGSSWSRILRQYGVDDPHLAGVFVDPRSPVGVVTLGTLAREAARVAKLQGWATSRETQWVILPQAGADLREFNGGCGEHDDLHVAGRPFYVDLIPSFTNKHFTGCVYSYSADDGLSGIPDYQGSLVAATTSITSHEYAEAATNPWASTGLSYGWTSNTDDAEIADLCAWYSTTPPGLTVNVSYLWSDLAHGCVAY